MRQRTGAPQRTLSQLLIDSSAHAMHCERGSWLNVMHGSFATCLRGAGRSQMLRSHAESRSIGRQRARCWLQFVMGAQIGAALVRVRHGSAVLFYKSTLHIEDIGFAEGSIMVSHEGVE